jgi:hypothetical protein
MQSGNVRVKDEISDMERLEDEETIRAALSQFRTDVSDFNWTVPQSCQIASSGGSPSTQSAPAADAKPDILNTDHLPVSVLLALPLIPIPIAAPPPTVQRSQQTAIQKRNLKRPQRTAGKRGNIKRLRTDDTTAGAEAKAGALTLPALRNTKSTRLAKSRPALAERGLIPMVRANTNAGQDEKGMAYHELWFVVPRDYILRDGLHHSDEERQQTTEIPIRLLRPNANVAPTTVDELLIPAQDLGKLVGIRAANVSKDVIYKICGTVPVDDRTKAVVVHEWGQTMSAPTPSSVRNGSDWQRQKCIRVEKVLKFLAGRKKPAGVDAVLREGLKTYPIVSTSSGAGSASAAAAASASASASASVQL